MVIPVCIPYLNLAVLGLYEPSEQRQMGFFHTNTETVALLCLYVSVSLSGKTLQNQLYNKRIRQRWVNRETHHTCAYALCVCLAFILCIRHVYESSSYACSPQRKAPSSFSFFGQTL